MPFCYGNKSAAVIQRNNVYPGVSARRAKPSDRATRCRLPAIMYLMSNFTQKAVIKTHIIPILSLRKIIASALHRIFSRLSFPTERRKGRSLAFPPRFHAYSSADARGFHRGSLSFTIILYTGVSLLSFSTSRRPDERSNEIKGHPRAFLWITRHICGTMRPRGYVRHVARKLCVATKMA